MKIPRHLQITLWATMWLSFASFGEAQTTPPMQRPTAFSDQTEQLMDFSILEVVLTDLLKNHDFNEALGDKYVLLGAKAPAQPLNTDLMLNTAGKQVNSLPADVWTDLWKRNHEMALVPSFPHDSLLLRDEFKPERYEWENFHPRNPQISVHDIRLYLSGIEGWAQFKHDYPEAKGFISAWLPGYSKDRKTAVLHFMVGPGAHGGFGTYLLIHSGGQWKIKWSALRYSL
ncbi:MAG: hypothetical protein JWL77_2423 [Chthonomonadaceae bacterium]|nr:hypothetical protein [Chthonomonadaceae bacterium]